MCACVVCMHTKEDTTPAHHPSVVDGAFFWLFSFAAVSVSDIGRYQIHTCMDSTPARGKGGIGKGTSFIMRYQQRRCGLPNENKQQQKTRCACIIMQNKNLNQPPPSPFPSQRQLHVPCLPPERPHPLCVVLQIPTPPPHPLPRPQHIVQVPDVGTVDIHLDTLSCFCLCVMLLPPALLPLPWCTTFPLFHPTRPCVPSHLLIILNPEWCIFRQHPPKVNIKMPNSICQHHCFGVIISSCV